MPPDHAYCAAISAYIGREARPVEKYGHQPRLYALAKQVGAGQEYDDDILFAAAWLHDLGVFTGHRPEDLAALAQWDNTEYAVERAPAILTEAGFPQEKVPGVLEAIRTHQPTFDPTTIEGIILRDADILEQLGAVGILRTVCKVGRDTRFATFTAAVVSLSKALASLPQQLRLDTARALSVERIKTLSDFLQAVEDEAGELLF